MITIIENIISAQQLDIITQFLHQQQFSNGKLSAIDVAKEVKNNEEIVSLNDPKFQSINTMIMNTIINHPVFKASTLMQKIGAPIFARYHQGMQYGTHVDNPLMGQLGSFYRTDISMTLFLNEPHEYEGGELVIETNHAEKSYKLSAGTLITYPSTQWHRVNEVLSGERLVCVTWAQSMVKDPSKREILYNLYQANNRLIEKQSLQSESKQVNFAYTKLVQMWAEC